MPILPAFALFVILSSWPLVLYLVNAVWTERLLARYQDHWLVRLREVADLRAIEQACAGFHADSGRGSPVVHHPPQLVRALLVRHLLALSLRATEARLDTDLLVKLFVGYGLFERPLDHSTLCRFELWVLRHHDRLFFNEVLKQVYQVHPEERQRLLLTDTFGMFVRGARTSTIELLRDLSRHLLQEVEQIDPLRAQSALAQVGEAALLGQRGDKITPALTPQERTARLQTVVNAALDLHADLLAWLNQTPCAPEAEVALRLWLTAIAKVVEDETTVTVDPTQPGGRLITERPHGKKGTYRIACANDLDGTYRDHGKGAAQLQHNAGLLTSRRYVHETEVVTGVTPDQETLSPLLQNLHDHQDFFPPKVAGDQIYGTGKTRAQVEQLTQGQTQLVALVPAYEKRTDRFVPADFTLAEDGLSLTCPHGVTATQIYPKAGADGHEFRFTHTMCQGCPFWITPEQYQQNPSQPHCRPPDGKPRGHRQVFISDYRDYILAALAYNKTDPFKIEIRQRPLVERIIFNLTHFFGARHARSTGLVKANFQLRMAAAAFNLRQLVRETDKKRPPKAGVCPAAA